MLALDVVQAGATGFVQDAVPGSSSEQRLCEQLAKPVVLLLLALMPSIVSYSCHSKGLHQP